MYKWGKDEKRCKRLNVLSVEKFLRLMSLVMLKLFNKFVIKNLIKNLNKEKKIGRN